ncbi:BON domain-containing protein [Rubinisphaera margarita]|uniref:BON domain-containing protein n=1 Tax=Rubinisphaera margarita TaxID=2909586 RepID=UPI001EE9408D|nr:BON domain-containing protein [Rubinisphaera margarita]MCG6154826.1 BON domain-containing protein [Rubinisphaera margarita]
MIKPRPLLFLSCIVAALCLATGEASAQTFQGGGGQSAGATSRQATGGQTAGPQTGATAGNRGGQTGQGAAAEGLMLEAGTSASIDRAFPEGFVGRTDNPDRFIGNNQAGPAVLNQQPPTYDQRNGSQVQGGQPSRTSTVRPRIRLGFDVSPTGTLSARNSLTPVQPLTSRLSRESGFSGVRIERNPSGVLTLTGVVSSERERKLAEAFVRLEPGVRSINNEILVVPR